MKALIVDDEEHVVEAVRLLVPWSELGISEVFAASSEATLLSGADSHPPPGNCNSGCYDRQ